MGADFYEAAAPQGLPAVGIGAGSLIQGAIVDKNCRIGREVRVANEKQLDASDQHDTCLIRDGIPVVVKDGILPDGWSLEG